MTIVCKGTAGIVPITYIMQWQLVGLNTTSISATNKDNFALTIKFLLCCKTLYYQPLISLACKHQSVQYHSVFKYIVNLICILI